VNLIRNTTTEKGLVIKTRLDESVYEKGIKISDEELASIFLKLEDFHGDWNYVISPEK